MIKYPTRAAHLAGACRALYGVLAASVLLLAWHPAPAFAHAYLESSTPPAGERATRAPSEVVMRFDEPLNPSLSTAAIYAVPRGARVSARVSFPRSAEMVLSPDHALPRGAYRVEWHSVSAVDGHEVEGSLSFGVQVAALGRGSAAVAGPLAGLGWLRAVVRAAMYAALFVFTAALLLRMLLGGPGSGLWVAPAAVRSRLGDGASATLQRREQQLVIDAGWAALALTAASALVETQIAAGGISGSSIHAFLLTGTTGFARVALVALVAYALLGAAVASRAAGIAAAFALGALALSGHADSASPRALSVAVDWLHLLAGALWLGGIAVIVLVWLGQLRGAGRELRLAVMRSVLPRFGRVALPAFVLVACTGLLNAYIQVRQPSLLWSSSYGRALLVKSAVVATIALLSYTHALRLRPRLLAANPHPAPALERRHWRLLRAEPLLGIALAMTVALLVSFPAPEQIAQGAAAARLPLEACNPCVLPLPASNQLAVAGYAAGEDVAAWVERRDGELRGQVRVLEDEAKPASTPFAIEGALAVSPSCGPGCRAFTLPGGAGSVNVVLNPDHGEQAVALAARWQPAASAYARRILERAQATMRSLQSVTESEVVSSVPGVSALTRYTLRAPDRLAWGTSVLRAGQQPQFEDAEVEIGSRHWSRAAGVAAWQAQPASDELPFSMPRWFVWTDSAEVVRLLRIEHTASGAVAALALMDPGAPLWQTLRVDLRSGRVLGHTSIDPGHTETDRFGDFDSAPPIMAPRPRS